MMDFIINYGFDILIIVLSLLSIICLALKKTKLYMKDTIFEKVLSRLPTFIRVAESSVHGAEEKKSFVLGLCFTLLCDLTGKDSSSIAKEYGDRLSKAIEDILSTPEKKGVIYD